MPVFRSRTALELVRNVRAFLNVEGGVTRGPVPGAVSEDPEARKPKNKSYQPPSPRETSEEAADSIPVAPENISWIFATARSGTTWLSDMFGSAGFDVWSEPLVGRLFGEFYYNNQAGRRRRSQESFILGEPRKLWLSSIRSMVLEGAQYRFPGSGEVVIKEPNGSIGSPLMCEALPESKVIVLVRDPRDVVASAQDARKEGGWRDNQLSRSGDSAPVGNPESFARKRAESYMQGISHSLEAAEAHPGPSVIVRYEDLLRDSLGEMRRICNSFGLAGDLEYAVKKNSWDEIPKEKKGEGKFYRKASPGGWLEDLTPEQVKIVEEVAAPILEKFYPE